MRLSSGAFPQRRPGWRPEAGRGDSRQRLAGYSVAVSQSSLLSGDAVYPRPVGRRPHIDAGHVGFSATNSVRDCSHEDPAAIVPKQGQGTTGVSLSRIEKEAVDI